MNRKQTLAAIRALPYMTASYDTDSREYRVTFKGLTAAAAERKACYTPDPLDAVGTAAAMSKAWAAERAGAYAATLHMRDIMDANHKAAVQALTAIPGVGSGRMGLTPDSVKASPEYQRARAASEAAFNALRAANDLLVKNFAVELAADRAARRAA